MRLRSRALVGAAALALSACGSVPSVNSQPKGEGSAVAVTPEMQHTLEKLNEYRAAAGAKPLVLDAQLNAFAFEGSTELAAGGPAHGHFQNAGGSIFNQGFCRQAAENQAPGWPGADINKVIDGVLASMMSEGPGGGHHDNILNPGETRVGVGLVVKGGGLYFTNDFSANCQ